MKRNNILTRLIPASRRYTAWRFDELEMKLNTPASENDYCLSFPMYESGTDTSNSRKQRLIVSLTSFPERIPTIYPCLYSLLHQSLKPDMVILWLSKEQFPNESADLPKDLLYLQGFGLTIRFVEDDLKPHKKYFYAFKDFPNDLMVLADDDILYPTSWLQVLYDGHIAHPDCICGVRGRNIRLLPNGTGFAPYTDWDLCEFTQEIGPTHKILLTCGAGTIFPAAFSSNPLLDADLIKEYALLADDLWLKTMALKQNISYVKISWPSDVISVPASQTVNLFTNNMFLNGNDQVINKLAAKFEEWKELV